MYIYVYIYISIKRYRSLPNSNNNSQLLYNNNMSTYYGGDSESEMYQHPTIMNPYADDDIDNQMEIRMEISVIPKWIIQITPQI